MRAPTSTPPRLSSPALSWRPVWAAGALLPLLALGCSAEKSGEADEKAEADSASPTGADGGADGADGGDTGPGEPVETLPLRVAVTEPAGAGAGPVRVSLVPLDFGAGLGGPRLGAPIAEGAVEEGVAVLALPVAVPATELDGLARALPGVQGALYGLVAWAPAGEDAVFAEGEALLGVALDRLLLFRGPGEAPAGWPEGWSVVDSGMAGMYEPNRCLYDTTEPLLWREAEGYPRFFTLDEAVPLTLRGREAGLAVDLQLGALSGGQGRYGLVPHQLAVGADPELEAVFDEPLPPPGEGLGFTLDAPPPAAHDLTADPDWRHTLAYGVPYVDIDGDERWSASDPMPEVGTCHERTPVAFRYTRPVTTWRGLRLLDCYSGQVGWRLVRWDAGVGNEVYLPAEAGLALRSEDGCAL